MANDSRDFYTILGVEQNATPKQLKAMYHKLAKKYHADTNSEDTQLRKWSHEMMVELNNAYSILKDPTKRKEYNRQRNNKNTGNTNAHFASEIVYIQTIEQAKEILFEGINNFSFGAPTSELEEDCKRETKKLINKKPQNYIRMGIPNKYPMAYLSSAIENAAADAMERIQEKVIHGNVFQLYFIINLIIGFIAAFKMAKNFFEGIPHFLGYMFAAVFYYMIITWIARFIARGFKSNLTGLRGLITNGLIAIILVIILIGSTFFSPDIDEEGWVTYTSSGNKFSVQLPYEPKFKNDVTFNFIKDKPPAEEIILKTRKVDYMILWATHPNLRREYSSIIKSYEKNIYDDVKLVENKMLSNYSHLFRYEFPEGASGEYKIILIDNTIFQIAAVAKNGNIDTRYITKFFQSFKVLN